MKINHPGGPGMRTRWLVQMRCARGKKWWPVARYRTRAAARQERHWRAIHNPDDHWRVVAIRAGREGRG